MHGLTLSTKESGLTESEALALDRWSLAFGVNRGLIATLTAVVALPSMADPLTHHGCKDDLDPVHVSRQVRPYKCQRIRTAMTEELKEQNIETKVTLHRDRSGTACPDTGGTGGL